MDRRRSTPLDALTPGARFRTEHRVTAADLAPVAALLGEAEGALPARAAGALMTHLIATAFPGFGTAILREDYRYAGTLAEGDALTAEIEVTEVDRAAGRARLACRVLGPGGAALLAGEAEVAPPRVAEEREVPALPGASPRPVRVLRALLARCAGLPPVPTAVVHPCDAESLRGALLAAEHGLIAPILVGPEAKIRGAAAAAGLDIAALPLVPAPHSHAAAELAVAQVREGRAAALMKGSLHTDELMAAALAREAGLRTERRVSHCFVVDAPLYPRPLLITDAAVNIQPDLEAKADIARNAIALARAIGIELPKVAILSAVETVTPKIPSTIDAAALCKMAERGQIVGGVLDGPLAFDNAVSPAAARAKGITSPVAGQADVLLCPDLESGNMLAKQLTYLGGAESAGIVLGLRVPVALTSRADSATARLGSAALLRLMAPRAAAPAPG
ncbi:bifunctional enoyl-CoA hydratase/phosphate acetyltransferase [Caldovatus sp. SYSU G05006]|uniref:Bifunctional enoyl-CoA hydratase/phosphate acetyltransferase n=2 Tax=Caldovatus aquaticus TaxID=2865671 RepID=A0ABS7F368_9PROT|nr:bifunctional enoyl-CoA hydratase/phosphate acetyltransferase [Caldovatus aquaticus]MBW8269271.1 bifunctional enoyl-CoA hydratase/phosphate acetyltransferase [Caldovatus aquaticus]